jgi:hypothetical protein
VCNRNSGNRPFHVLSVAEKHGAKHEAGIFELIIGAEGGRGRMGRHD